jgi:hypothetical protein
MMVVVGLLLPAAMCMLAGMLLALAFSIFGAKPSE